MATNRILQDMPSLDLLRKKTCISGGATKVGFLSTFWSGLLDNNRRSCHVNWSFTFADIKSGIP